ncbi:hypothetical protein B0H16DRAFT_56136 [Mycena metata]|uniref:Secreted protein n=1 Tax=Mycena metata TaxID=1033252 RepID=A0AAD7IFN7_9AGAR|nr:hypothetical protein B0H16DRAFT_56136 [Mycena metata]
MQRCLVFCMTHPLTSSVPLAAPLVPCRKYAGMRSHEARVFPVLFTLSSASAGSTTRRGGSHAMAECIRAGLACSSRAVGIHAATVLLHTVMVDGAPTSESGDNWVRCNTPLECTPSKSKSNLLTL